MFKGKKEIDEMKRLGSGEASCKEGRRGGELSGTVPLRGESDGWVPRLKPRHSPEAASLPLETAPAYPNC